MELALSFRYFDLFHDLDRCIARDYQLQGFGSIIDRLMNRAGWNVYEVTGPDRQRFFKVLTDAKAAIASDDVYGRLAVDVEMGARRTTGRDSSDGQMYPGGPCQSFRHTSQSSHAAGVNFNFQLTRTDYFAFGHRAYLAVFQFQT